MSDASDGIDLLGSEMLTWSDFAGEVGPFGGRLARMLLHDVATTRGRALVAGPHTAEVVADVAAHAAGLDVLVRSYRDARELRTGLPDDVRVLCGPLDRVTRPEGGYAVVVAVAGLDRLHSAEEQRPGWPEIVDGLVALLADDGELFVGVGNDVGLDRILSLSPGARHHDADWPEARLADDVVPPSAEAVTAHLANHAGLTLVESWACHGHRGTPVLAAPTRTLADRRADLLLQRLVGGAYAVDDPAAPLVKDPVTTGADLVRAGLGAATAPMTVLHLRHGGETGVAGDDVVLAQERDRDPGLLTRLTATEAGWLREVLDAPAAGQVAPGAIRDPARLAGLVPQGRTLAELLEAALADHDLATAGRWVRTYAAWLDPDGTGSVAGARVATRPADLVTVGDGLALLDATMVADRAEPGGVVLLRGLLDLTAALLARGVRQPWEPSVTPRAAATALAAAADVEGTDDQLDAAVALDGRLRPPDVPVPDFSVAGGGRHPATYAELAELVGELSARATQSDAHIVWLLRNIQTRQRTIRRTRGALAEVEGSREYRIGRRLFVVRDRVRRWQKRRELDAKGPRGEWRDRSSDEPKEIDREVEADLLPPGYTPGGDDDVTVVPAVGDGPEKPRSIWRLRP